MQADRQIQDLSVVRESGGRERRRTVSGSGMHYIHDVIDPSDTRDYIIRALPCRSAATGAPAEWASTGWQTGQRNSKRKKGERLLLKNS